MEAGSRKHLLEKRVNEVDAVIPSPKDRAAFIHGVLQEHAPNLTVWDKVAAFAEMLGAFSIAEPGLEDVVKPLLVRVHTIHYLHGRDLTSCLTKSNLPEPQDSTKLLALESMELTDPE
jgi:hypothetical protein